MCYFSLGLISLKSILERWTWCVELIWKKLLRRWMELLVPSLRWVSLFSVSNNIRSRWNLTASYLFLWTGCVHWGRYVCPTREKGARHTRRFRNGSSKGNEERNGEEHVAEEIVEVNVYYTRQLDHIWLLMDLPIVPLFNL